MLRLRRDNFCFQVLPSLRTQFLLAPAQAYRNIRVTPKSHSLQGSRSSCADWLSLNPSNLNARRPRATRHPQHSNIVAELFEEVQCSRADCVFQSCASCICLMEAEGLNPHHQRALRAQSSGPWANLKIIHTFEHAAEPHAVSATSRCEKPTLPTEHLHKVVLRHGQEPYASVQEW